MVLFKFKTNVASEAEVRRITPILDRLEGIENWKIDAVSAENILSIAANDLNPQQVENALAQAGFNAEVLRVMGMGGDDV